MTKYESHEKRFVVDAMLGKLAKWLRILGFDTRYERLDRPQQLEHYRKEGFYIITRKQRWMHQDHVYFLSSNDSMDQLKEVIAQIPIAFQEVRLLHRCIVCNHELERLPRDLAFGQVPDYIFETNILFFQCTKCSRVYWPGSHPKRMMERLQERLGWKSFER